ncbi:MAG: cyclic-phosphate processing receiver domain-containing protein [Isosphaerales bacterium]
MNSRASRKDGENGKRGGIRAPWFAGIWKPRFSWIKNRPRPRRLLFLDDDPARAEAFLSENPEAVWVETVAECIVRLVENWDEIHLDHDLGGRTYVDTNENDCGMEVIRWLCKEPRAHLRQTLFFVHTHNSVAGLLMVLQMRASGYKAEFRPFGLDLARLLAHDEADLKEDAETSAAPAAPLRRWLLWLRSWRGERKAAPGPRHDPK